MIRCALAIGLALANLASSLSATDCYGDKSAFPYCWRFRAYGTGPDKQGSMGYFIVPVGICNDAGRELIRFFLEPSVETWFRLRCTNQDFQDSWVCGRFAASDFRQNIRVGWDGGIDGAITSKVCAPVTTSFTDVEDDDFQAKVKSCRDFEEGPCATKTCCPANGFNVGLFVFRAPISNGKPWAADPGGMKPLIWIGPIKPSEQTLRNLAADFLEQLTSRQPSFLPLEGCPFPCCDNVWLDTLIEIADLIFVDPDPSTGARQPPPPPPGPARQAAPLSDRPANETGSAR